MYSGGMRVDRRALKRFGVRSNALVAARRLRRRRYNYPSLKEEPKYLDQTHTQTIVYNANFVGCEANPAAVGTLTACQVGDAHNQRDGKKIILTQIHVQGKIVLPGVTGVTATLSGPTAVFLALILDTRTNGTETQAEQVFMTSIADASAKIPTRNLLYGGRFRILKFKRILFQNPTTAPQDTTIAVGTHVRYGQARYFKMFKKLRLPVNFDAGTGNDVANVTDNNISLIAWQNDQSTTDPILHYQCRTRWLG